MECPETIPLLKRLYYLPALSLRGRQALRHLADLSDSPGSDSSGGTSDQAVRSVGSKAGGSGGVNGEVADMGVCAGDAPGSLLARTGRRKTLGATPKLANQLANKFAAINSLRKEHTTNYF